MTHESSSSSSHSNTSGVQTMDIIQRFLHFPDNMILGSAVDDGGCFFDSLAQALNQLYNSTEYSEKSLRTACHHFYTGNTARVLMWLLEDMGSRSATLSAKKIEELKQNYYMVQYTKPELDQEFNQTPPIWGRPNVEARILCHRLGLPSIQIIEILDDPESNEKIAGLSRVTQDGMKQIDPEDGLFTGEVPTLVVRQDKMHFVPILREEEHIPQFRLMDIPENFEPDLKPPVELELNKQKPSFESHIKPEPQPLMNPTRQKSPIIAKKSFRPSSTRNESNSIHPNTSSVLTLEEAARIREDFFDRCNAGECDSKVPFFYEELAQNFHFSKIKNTQKLAFIVVAHCVHTLPPFIEAISRVGVVGAIIPKASFCVPEVKETQETLYGPIFRKDIGKASLKDQDSTRQFLQELFEKEEFKNHAWVILDHGGYFASRIQDILNEEGIKHRVLGIIEHTWNGEQSYEAAKTALPDAHLPIPVLSIARTTIKSYEDSKIAESIVDVLKCDIYSGGGINQDFNRISPVLIIGYGHLGTDIALKLKSILDPRKIYICEINPEAKERAVADFSQDQVSENCKEWLPEANLVILAASNRVLSADWLRRLKDGACIASVTSSDTLFEQNALDEYEEAPSTSTAMVTKYVHQQNQKKYFYLAAHGGSVNFLKGSTADPILSAVLATVCVAMVELIRKESTLSLEKIHPVSADLHGEIQGIWEKYHGYMTNRARYFGEPPQFALRFNQKTAVARPMLTANLWSYLLNHDPRKHDRMSKKIVFQGKAGAGKTHLALQYYGNYCLNADGHLTQNPYDLYTHRIWCDASSRSSLISSYRRLLIAEGKVSSADSDERIVLQMRDWFKSCPSPLLVLDHQPEYNLEDPETNFFGLIPTEGGHIVITTTSEQAAREDEINVPELTEEEAIELFTKFSNAADDPIDDSLKTLLANLEYLPEKIKKVASYVGRRNFDIHQVIKNLEEILADIEKSQQESTPEDYIITQKDLYVGDAPRLNLSKFIIRKEFTERLQESFSKSSNEAAITELTAMDGLGGVGKTQLALQYFWNITEINGQLRYETSNRYKRRIWWQAGSRSQMIKNYLMLGYQLKLTTLEDKPEEVIPIVKNYLQSSQGSGWLLVLDDAPTKTEDPETHIEEFIPIAGGHVLITSRSPEWGTSLAKTEISVTHMTLDEAVLLICKITGQKPDQDRELRASLIEKLGYLPLALTQAAAYMKQEKISLNDYLVLYDQALGPLFERMPAEEEHIKPVRITWDISRQKISENQKYGTLAIKILSLSAYLKPDNIPITLLEMASKEDETEETFITTLNFQNAITLIEDYSLSIRHQNLISLHVILQKLIYINHDNHSRWDFMERLITSFKTQQIFEIRKPEDFLVAENQYQHLTKLHNLMNEYFPEVLSHMEGDKLQHFCTTLIVLGELSLELGDSKWAQLLLEVALITQEIHDPSNYKKIIRILNYLAIAHGDLGNDQQKKELLERALKISEDHCGINSPQSAHILNDLAVAYGGLGNYKHKKTLLERSLYICQKEKGINSIDAAAPLANLAATYGKMGKIRQERKILKKASKVFTLNNGPDHPEIAQHFLQLGSLYISLKKPELALHYLNQALEIQRKYYQENHPKIAVILGTLGSVYEQNGDPVKAIEFLEKTVTILENYYGLNHPDTAIFLRTLGLAYGALQNFYKQIELTERALAIQRGHYGNDHPTIAETLANLGSAYGKVGYIRNQDIFEEAERIKNLHLRTGNFLEIHIVKRKKYTSSGILPATFKHRSPTKDPEKLTPQEIRRSYFEERAMYFEGISSSDEENPTVVSNWAISYHGLAIETREKRHFVRSEDLFQQAIALNPNYFTSHLSYTIFLITLDRDAESLVILNRILDDSFPFDNSSDISFSQYSSLTVPKELGLEIESHGKITLENSKILAYYLKIFCLNKLENLIPDELVEAFEREVEASTNDNSSWLYYKFLHHAYLLLKQKEKAEIALNISIALDPLTLKREQKKYNEDTTNSLSDMGCNLNLASLNPPLFSMYNQALSQSSDPGSSSQATSFTREEMILQDAELLTENSVFEQEIKSLLEYIQPEAILDFSDFSQSFDFKNFYQIIQNLESFGLLNRQNLIRISECTDLFSLKTTLDKYQEKGRILLQENLDDIIKAAETSVSSVVAGISKLSFSSDTARVSEIGFHTTSSANADINTNFICRLEAQYPWVDSLSSENKQVLLGHKNLEDLEIALKELNYYGLLDDEFNSKYAEIFLRHKNPSEFAVALQKLECCTNFRPLRVILSESDKMKIFIHPNPYDVVDGLATLTHFYTELSQNQKKLFFDAILSYTSSANLANALKTLHDDSSLFDQFAPILMLAKHPQDLALTLLSSPPFGEPNISKYLKYLTERSLLIFTKFCDSPTLSANVINQLLEHIDSPSERTINRILVRLSFIDLEKTKIIDESLSQIPPVWTEENILDLLYYSHPEKLLKDILVPISEAKLLDQNTFDLIIKTRYAIPILKKLISISTLSQENLDNLLICLRQYPQINAVSLKEIWDPIPIEWLTKFEFEELLNKTTCQVERTHTI